MRVILFILQKEFIQIFRNRTMLPLIFILPVVQLLILVNAATLEMKNINMIIVDRDMSDTSAELVSKFEGSGFFKVRSQQWGAKDELDYLIDNSADIILEIPAEFEKDLVRGKKAKVQLLINAIDGLAAGLINGYASGIVNDFQKNFASSSVSLFNNQPPRSIDASYRFWYNPHLEYDIYMLPGILVILVTIIGMFLTAINIVREKEMGTIEQINVTPILKSQFVVGKLIPFLLIALFELSFGLFIGRILFSLPFEGNLGLLFLMAFVFLLVTLGLGLLLSAISNSQQQVMFTVFFFLLIFILMSGLFTPAESMPVWARYLNYLNPFKYFMEALRMILLKGSGFRDVLHNLIYLSVYAALALSVAIWRYRKTV